MQKHLSKLNSTLKYLVAFAFLAVPLYPKFPFIVVSGTFVSIRLEDFIIAAIGLVWVLVMLVSRRPIIKDTMTKVIVVYLAIGFVSFLSAVFVTNTVTLSIGFLHWLRRIEYLIPFFVGSYVISINRNNLYFYFKLLLIVITTTFIYGYGQIHFSWPIIITQNQEYAKGIALRWIEGSHINSTFAGHYDLATFLILAMAVIVPAFFVLKGGLSKIILLFSFVFSLWLLANAGSRVSLVSYMIAVTFSLVLIRKYKPIILIIVISSIFFASTTVVMTRYERIFDVLRVRLQSVSTELVINPVYAKEVVQPGDPKVENQKASPQPEDRSSSIRLNVEWPRAIRALTKNPLLGTGYSSITLATDNDYLRALGETGILGFISFALIFVNLIVFYIRKLPFPKNFKGIELVFVAGTFAALPGLFLNAVFIDIFEASKFAIMFWFITGFSYTVLRDNFNE